MLHAFRLHIRCGRLTGRSQLAFRFALLLFGLSLALPGASTAQSTTTPYICSVGVDVLSLHSLNIDANTFDAGFWIWSVCPDDRYKPLSTLDFVNANSVTMTKQTSVTQDGVYWEYAEVEGTFRYAWNLKDYPFDQHTLEIHIENADQDASTFIFEPDTTGSAFEPDLPLDGWEVTGFSVATSIHTYHTTYGDPQNSQGTSDYSRLTVSIDMERTDLSGFLKLTFVVYMAFLLSLVSYFINLNNPTMLTARLSVISAALFAVAVNFRTVTTALSSEETLTMVGMIHVVTLFAIVIDAVAALATQIMIERGYSEAKARRFDRNMMIWVVTAYVLINIVLIGGFWLGIF